MPFNPRKAEETWPDDTSKWIRAVTGFDFDRRNAETTLAELVTLIEDLETAVPATGGPRGEPATRVEREADRQIPKTLSVTGNDASVDGKVYVVGDPEAAFIKALVDAGPGVFVPVRIWAWRFNHIRNAHSESCHPVSGRRLSPNGGPVIESVRCSMG